jgi:arginyl-tRNA synthetase
LAAAILKYSDIVQDVTDDLKINNLTEYIYEIATKISEGYKKYKVIDEEHKSTRILLCEATRRLLKHAFYLVGIVPVD